MPGRVVVQWDKDDCADLGLVKVDLLGLGMMAVLQDALAIVNRSTSPPVDLAHLPPDDPEVYHLLQTADTIGVFQVESRAQMATLPRLKPTCFYDLVVEVAIIRPGPDRRPDGAPVSESPARRRAGDLPASVARAGAEAHARRAAVPGAAAAHRDGGRQLHRRRGRGAAPRDGLQALRGAHEGDRGAACARAWPATASPAPPPTRSSWPSRRSRSTASPSRTPPASR